jgi:hypothetical protein
MILLLKQFCQSGGNLIIAFSSRRWSTITDSASTISCRSALSMSTLLKSTGCPCVNLASNLPVKKEVCACKNASWCKLRRLVHYKRCQGTHFAQNRLACQSPQYERQHEACRSLLHVRLKLKPDSSYAPELVNVEDEEAEMLDSLRASMPEL